MWKVEHVETIPPPGLTKTICTEITLSPDRAPQVVEQVEGEVEPRWKEVPHNAALHLLVRLTTCII